MTEGRGSSTMEFDHYAIVPKNVELEIIEKSYTTFGELPIDRVGHEAYPSKEVQRETFKKYYKRDIADDEKILVLGFKVLNFL